MSKKRLFRVPNKGYGGSFDSLQAIGGLTLALDYRWGVYTDTAMTTRAVVGQTVKGWQDRSGNDYHATEAANPPTLAADGLQFDGANDVLRVARMTGAFSAGFTYFIVASLVDGQPSAGKYIFGAVASAPTRRYFGQLVFTNGALIMQVSENGIDASTTIKTFQDGATASFISSVVANPAANLTGYYDGTQAGTPAALTGFTWASIATSVTEAPFIAASSSAGTPVSFCACTIKSVLIYNRPLSTAELTIVHRYLGNAHGITVP